MKPSRGSLGGGSFISQCCGVYNNNKYYTGGAEGSIFEWQGKSGNQKKNKKKIKLLNKKLNKNLDHFYN